MIKSKSIIIVAGLLLILSSPLNAEPSGRLYSFANPLPGPLKFADHTWVTDYPERPSCPKPDANYWYSTGDCHPDASDNPPRPLSSAKADIGIARCIATPNDEGFNWTATAHIVYGIDGVCHQIANRILTATGGAGRTPITVEGANGYRISRFFYGLYGDYLRPSDWKKLRADCKVPVMPIRTARTDLVAMSEQAGLQSKLAILQEEQNLARRLIANIGDRARHKDLSPDKVATQVNMIVNDSLQRLVSKLGPEDFQRFFAWTPGKKIILVYPEIAARVKYGEQ